MPTKRIIESKSTECKSCYQSKHFHNSGNSSGAVYGIGIIGAAYYFIPQAVGVTGLLVAALKSLAWPGLLVYQALLLLKL